MPRPEEPPPMERLNPYEPPDVSLAPPVVTPRNPRRVAEVMRRRHLDDEALVRSVALGFWIVAILSPLVFGYGIWQGWAVGWSQRRIPIGIAALLCPLLASLIGRGLSRREPWARLSAAGLALAGIALTASWTREALASANPLTVFSLLLFLVPQGLVLYILISRDGRLIFSSRYREAVAATPRLRPRTSILVPLAFLVAGLWSVVGWFWQSAGR